MGKVRGVAPLVVGSVVILALGCGVVSCGTPASSTEPSLPPSALPSVPPSQTVEPSPAVDLSQAAEPSPTTGLTSPQQPFSIVMYINVVAGDYSVLRILSSGQAEFTGYNRLNQILERRQGDLGTEGAARLFRLLEERGFFDLDSEYDVYPQAPGDTTVYEDAYFWVRVSVEGRPERTVVAHEMARPPNLTEITTVLLGVVPQLPEVPARGTFAIAGDAEMLHYARLPEGKPDLELDGESVRQYPLLEQALRNPYSLVEVGTLEGAGLGEVLTGEVGTVEVVFEGQRFALLLLKGEG
jgi:hypothetical protein